MITVGIDIGKEKHAAAILGADGRLLAKPAFFDNTHDGAKKLWALIARHGGGDGVRVGMESTGNCWKPFHDFLAAKGATVDVINPIVTSASMAGDVRGRKTDKRDAVVIAGIVARGEHAARRPEDESERDLKCLTRQRRYLVSDRTGSKNRLRDQLLESFPEFPALFKDLYQRFAWTLALPPQRVRDNARRFGLFACSAVWRHSRVRPCKCLPESNFLRTVIA